MIKIVVAVKDQAVEFFGTPFVVHTKQEAIRSFILEVQNPESTMAKSPTDYDLFALGTYDTDTGQIKGHEPMRLMRAIEVQQGAAQ